MAAYKLYFFKTIRADVCRLILALGEQKYEEYPIDKSDWHLYKDKAPLGQVPFLEIQNGETAFRMSQTLAISRFLAKKVNLVGADDFEQALVDMWADQITDLRNELHKAYVIEKSEKNYARLKEEYVPRYLKTFEERLIENKSGFLVGNQLTWPDLYLYSSVGFIRPEDLAIGDYPAVKTHFDMIKSLPKLSDFKKY